MRITRATTYIVGNPWKNWLLVRLDTDQDGPHGVDLNWSELAKHPYQRQNFLPRFATGWERRGGEREPAPAAAARVAAADQDARADDDEYARAAGNGSDAT